MNTLHQLFAFLSLLFLVATVVMGIVAVIDWLRRPPEASEADVRLAVERYRDAYGDEVQHVLADHIYGARLARASRHKRMLCRVSEKIGKEDGPAPIELRRRNQ